MLEIGMLGSTWRGLETGSSEHRASPRPYNRVRADRLEVPPSLLRVRIQEPHPSIRRAALAVRNIQLE